MIRQLSLLACSLLVLTTQGSYYPQATLSSSSSETGFSPSSESFPSEISVNVHILFDFAKKAQFGLIRGYITANQHIYHDHPQWLNTQDENNNTVLHLALEAQHLQCYTYLVEQGVDYTIKNKDGETVQDFVIGNQRFAEVLQKQKDTISKKLKLHSKNNKPMPGQEATSLDNFLSGNQEFNRVLEEHKKRTRPESPFSSPVRKKKTKPTSNQLATPFDTFRKLHPETADFVKALQGYEQNNAHKNLIETFREGLDLNLSYNSQIMPPLRTPLKPNSTLIEAFLQVHAVVREAHSKIAEEVEIDLDTHLNKLDPKFIPGSIYLLRQDLQDGRPIEPLPVRKQESEHNFPARVLHNVNERLFISPAAKIHAERIIRSEALSTEMNIPISEPVTTNDTALPPPMQFLATEVPNSRSEQPTAAVPAAQPTGMLLPSASFTGPLITTPKVTASVPPSSRTTDVHGDRRTSFFTWTKMGLGLAGIAAIIMCKRYYDKKQDQSTDSMLSTK